MGVTNIVVFGVPRSAFCVPCSAFRVRRSAFRVCPVYKYIIYSI